MLLLLERLPKTQVHVPSCEVVKVCSGVGSDDETEEETEAVFDMSLDEGTCTCTCVCSNKNGLYIYTLILITCHVIINYSGASASLLLTPLGQVLVIEVSSFQR